MSLPHILFDKKLDLAEGPLWDAEAGKLYIVNINQSELYSFDLQSGDERCYTLPDKLGAVALTRNHSKLLVAVGQRFGIIDLESGRAEPFGLQIERGLATRLNDGKAGPDGCFYVGTTHLEFSKNIGSFYRLDKSGNVSTLFSGVVISNGLGWSSDGTTMYYADSASMQILAYPFNVNRGELGTPVLAVNICQPGDQVFPNKLADGLCVDSRGDLWVAIYGQGMVNHYDFRTGALIDQIRVPAPNVTNCTFGGPNLDTLYITTARQEMTPAQLEQYPLAGGIFMVRPGVTGPVSYRFGI